jgi:hypothetical protein
MYASFDPMKNIAYLFVAETSALVNLPNASMKQCIARLLLRIRVFRGSGFVTGRQ